MPNEQRMMVSSLRASGMGYGTIARKVGVSKYSEIVLPQEYTAIENGTAVCNRCA